MRNIYANRVARCDGSTFLREKGRQSAMTASSGFNGSCDYRSKPGHKQAQCFKFLRESGGGPLSSSGTGRSSWSSLYNTHLHDNADCRAQQQHCSSSSGSGYNCGNNNSGNGNRRHHGDGSNTGRVSTAVAQPTARFRLQPSPLPRLPCLLRLLQVLHPGYFRGCSYAVRHRVASIGHWLFVSRRLRHS